MTHVSEQKVTFRMVDLCRLVERYMQEEDVKKVYDAFLLAADAHDGVFRKSGEPYITHPIEVAHTLADFHLDANTICAALLHDVIEDSSYTYEDIAEQFGETVAHLVEGVTKLKQQDYKDRQQAGIYSFKKMMQAMIRDYRVILIKLADRLHNVRTLGSMPAHKQRRIARETLEIHVPLARRMGMNSMRHDLQVHAFKALHPWRSTIIENWWQSCYEQKSTTLERHVRELQTTIDKENIVGNVFPWEKNIYRIYTREKERSSTKRFETVNFPFNIRITTRNRLDCYRILGIVHQMFRRKIGTFKDFISVPKVYGFQALETTVITREKELIRFQIQSDDMYQVAQYGITAENRYPHLTRNVSAVDISQQRLSNWLEQVREIEQATGNNADEFLADIKADFFFNEVSVTTPKGDSRILPTGATPVDFAYAIHTDIGHHCNGALVDGRRVALNSQLHDGANIEILTNENASPHPSWLNFVVTGKARAAIRHWINNKRDHEFVELGRNILEQAMQKFDLSLDNITDNSKQQVLETLDLDSEEDLFKAIGKGEHCSRLISRRLLNNAGLQVLPEDQESSLLVKSTEGLAVQLASCCHPIPTDTIVGSLSPGGLEIHRANCSMLKYTQSIEPLTLSWSEEADPEHRFQVPIQIQTKNEVGVLFTITGILQNHNINIEELDITGEKTSKTMQLLIGVHHANELEELISEIRQETSVLAIQRTHDMNTTRGA